MIISNWCKGFWPCQPSQAKERERGTLSAEPPQRRTTAHEFKSLPSAPGRTACAPASRRRCTRSTKCPRSCRSSTSRTAAQGPDTIWSPRTR
eukprot:27584-Eustigmatos_ZCMA.PRE.1